MSWRWRAVLVLQGYEPKFWFFEVVSMLLKLALSATTVLFLPESIAKVRCVCGDVLACACSIVVHFRLSSRANVSRVDQPSQKRALCSTLCARRWPHRWYLG